MTMTTEERRDLEARAIVALAFRNGPIEDVHAGRQCPACDGQDEYSRITDPEMKEIMKAAVDRVYTLLKMKDEHPEQFEGLIQFGARYTQEWDEAQMDQDLVTVAPMTTGWLGKTGAEITGGGVPGWTKDFVKMHPDDNPTPRISPQHTAGWADETDPEGRISRMCLTDKNGSEAVLDGLRRRAPSLARLATRGAEIAARDAMALRDADLVGDELPEFAGYPVASAVLACRIHSARTVLYWGHRNKQEARAAQALLRTFIVDHELAAGQMERKTLDHNQERIAEARAKLRPLRNNMHIQGGITLERIIEQTGRVLENFGNGPAPYRTDDRSVQIHAETAELHILACMLRAGMGLTDTPQGTDQ